MHAENSPASNLLGEVDLGALTSTRVATLSITIGCGNLSSLASVWRNDIRKRVEKFQGEALELSLLAQGAICGDMRRDRWLTGTKKSATFIL